jgi:hypothetical protein
VNRITKDTPVGTRVIIISAGLRRGTLVGWSKISGLVCRVETDSLVDGFHMDNVYLDEPAPGTWVWACERLLAGNVRRRSFPDENYVTLETGKLTWGDFTDFVPHFEDLTATNWEIAP